ncbi:MAG: hypothetical protein JWP12_966 [Bacteroidetes bacterium]|nr:hypothetical protein [Bacteroidota bacterium]
MFKTSSIIAFCFLSALLLSNCAHQDFDASGIVVSPEKKIISHVAVIAPRFNGYDTVYTDSLGRFTISVFEGGFRLKGKSYVYLFKEGYKSKSRVTVRKDKINYIKLRAKR